MRATIMLCDHAEVADGKLFINGGGWDQVAPEGVPTGIAVLVHVDWFETNQQKNLSISLKDQDGQQVTQPTPEGDSTVTLEVSFEVGRPAGLPAGSESGVPFAFNIPPLSLAAAHSFYWLVEVDGEEVGRASFRTAPE